MMQHDHYHSTIASFKLGGHLADCTNGCAYGMMLHLSVCRL